MKALAKAGSGRVISNLGGNEKVVQNFCVEPLLCEECEQRISAWERDASEFLRKPAFDPKARMANLSIHFDKLQYPSLKLFLLSVLWRMGVSKLIEFRMVKLGPHEAILREMLLRSDPGSTETYGCSLQILTDQTGRIPVTRPADIHRVDQFCKLYRLVLDGFLFTWHVGQSDAVGRSPTRQWILREEGTWDIIFQDRRAVPFIHESLKSVMRMGAFKRNPIKRTAQ